MTYSEYKNHSEQIIQIQNRQSEFSNKLTKSMNKVKAMRLALSRSKSENNNLSKKLFDIEEELNLMSVKVYGNSAKSEVGVKNNPNLSSFLGNAYRGLSTTYGPTGQHKQSLEIANSILNKLDESLNIIIGKLPKLEVELSNMNAPVIIGVN